MAKPHNGIENPESSQIAEALRHRLSQLSYLAFAMSVARALKQLGYRDIPVPSRKSFRGPNATGGVDLTASRFTSLGGTRVLIQLKQYQTRSVTRRAVDEFRGVMLREGAPEGLIISTSGFSVEAEDAALGYPGRPVHLIDGEELGRLAEACGLGLLERGNPITGVRYRELDKQWFDDIEREADKLRRDSNRREDADV